MMDLREPKKKKRVRLQDRSPLPIGIDENGDWRVYTAHLSTSGTCIVDPVEMEAVYSMGFFGKGSLSKSFPSYGKKRFGAPPIVRNRQFVRREQWLAELESLNDESNSQDLEPSMKNGVDSTPEPAEETLRKGAEESSAAITIAPEITTEDKDGNVASEENIAEESKVPVGEKSDNKEEEKDKGCEEEKDRGCEQGEKEKECMQTNHDSSMEVAEVSGEENREASDSCAKEPISESRITSDEHESPAKKARMDVTESPDVDVAMDVSDLDATEDEKIRELEERAQEESSSHQDSTEKSTNENDDQANHEEANVPELLVLPDTDDDDTDNYLNNVKARIEIDKFPVNESLHLTFEESFFLMYGLGCLQLLYYDGSIFTNNNAWNYFQQQDKYFVQKYIVYHYFRSKGWVVKPGMKFGGDFLLYKQGPPFYHASYIVVIEVMDADTLIRDDAKSLRKMTWKNLIGLERLSETISKEILFAQILWPSTIVRSGDTIPIEALAEFTVRELLWRRWNPKRKQDIVPLDEEDSDST